MLKLDAHVHIFDPQIVFELEGRLQHKVLSMKDMIEGEGLTHYVAILDDLNLADALHGAGAIGLPFLWIHDLEDPVLDKTAAGYKIHPREPLGAGELFSISEEDVGRVCERVSGSGRPLLFHTDADEPRRIGLPSLAGLARQFTNVNFIAAHMGTCAAEYIRGSEGKEYTTDRWITVLNDAFEENVDLLLSTSNLYADTAAFGVYDPVRGPDPNLRFNTLAGTVKRLSPSHRKALADKLFIGTDFPCFWRPGGRVSLYRHQAECMKRIFGSNFDETRAAETFLNLLPDDFVAISR